MKAFGILCLIVGVVLLICFVATIAQQPLNAQQPSGQTSDNPVGNSQPVPNSQTQFTCPSADQVSSWMGTSVSQISEYCAFRAGDVQGQTLSNVICTDQDGGTTIEYTPVNEQNTLVVAACDGSPLPDIYGFTIRFVAAYPSNSASVCTIAQAANARQGPDPIPSDWTVQASC